MLDTTCMLRIMRLLVHPDLYERSIYWIYNEKFPSDSNKTTYGCNSLFLWVIQQPGEKMTSLGGTGDGRKHYNLQKNNSLINYFHSEKNFCVLLKHFMTRLYYTNISKPNTLQIILSKRFHLGTFRLICCSVLPLSSFSQISFHWNYFFGNISILPKILYSKPARKVSVTATEKNLIKLSSSCVSISLSNSTGKLELGIYVTSLKWVGFFPFSKIFVF